ncbi:MAG TPA: PIN domain-containing protein [Nitrososphaera sp.]
MSAGQNGVVFDTYAWVEYIGKGRHSDRVGEILNNTHYLQKVTPATVIAELRDRLLRDNTEESRIDQMIRFIAYKTRIYPCDLQVAYIASQISYEQKHNRKVKDWGMLDSLNYAVAQILNCLFVTGDPHFKNMNDVLFLD